MTIRVEINNPSRNRVVRTTGIGASPGSTQYDELVKLNDVVSVNPANNQILVYDSITGKYTIKTLPIVDGGSF
jgi:hypothetical protein